MLAGCATIAGSPTQSISVQTVDAQGRAIADMRCRLVNDAADYYGNSPMFDVQVRRSPSDLAILCERGGLIARATAVARGPVLGTVLLPGGSAAALIDHFTGYAYAYSATMQLRVGEHLVFDPHTQPTQRLLADAAGDAAR